MAKSKVQRISVSVVGAEEAEADLHRATALIGEVALAWASMEETLCRVLMSILSISEEAAKIVFYTPGSFSARADIIVNLVRHFVPACEYRDDLEVVIAKLRALHNTRNDLIHSMYVVNVGGRRSHLSRNMIHPRRKSLESRIPNPVSIFSDHLDILHCCDQFLVALVGITRPYPARSARYWLSMARNTSSATSA